MSRVFLRDVAGAAAAAAAAADEAAEDEAALRAEAVDPSPEEQCTANLPAAEPWRMLVRRDGDRAWIRVPVPARDIRWKKNTPPTTAETYLKRTRREGPGLFVRHDVRAGTVVAEMRSRGRGVGSAAPERAGVWDASHTDSRRRRRLRYSHGWQPALLSRVPLYRAHTHAHARTDTHTPICLNPKP